jgi:peroxiredoxin
MRAIRDSSIAFIIQPSSDRFASLSQVSRFFCSDLHGSLTADNNTYEREEKLMAKTESRMLSLGTLAPEFSLPDANGEQYSLERGDDAPATLVMFICKHCPFVKHVRQALARIGNEYQQKNVRVFAINSNDAETHPDDSPEKMLAEARTWGYEFPYLVDEDQSVAKAYSAACTPDFYLFDAARRLVYRGQLDGSRPENDTPITGTDLRSAIDETLAGRPVSQEQKPSIGCNIKWKPGSEPAYAAA